MKGQCRIEDCDCRRSRGKLRLRPVPRRIFWLQLRFAFCFLQFLCLELRHSDGDDMATWHCCVPCRIRACARTGSRSPEEGCRGAGHRPISQAGDAKETRNND